MFIRVHSRFLGQDQSLPFEPRMLEVQDHPDRQSGDSEIILHLSSFVICDPLDGLGIHDQFALHRKVRNILSDDLTPR